MLGYASTDKPPFRAVSSIHAAFKRLTDIPPTQSLQIQCCHAPICFPASWINESIEALVLQKFGADIWEKVRQEAKCTVPVGGFIRHEVYDDALTYALAIAVSKVRLPETSHQTRKQCQ
jgi:hypothetical protein